MVDRAVGVRSERDGGELRIRHDEILREQTAGTEEATVDDVARWLDRTDIRRVQQPRHRDEIAVRDVRSEVRMTTQSLRAGDVSSHDADAGAEIQAAEHPVEQLRIAAGTRDIERLEQPIVSDV